MTREEIKNTPELVDFMLDASVIVSSREKLRKRLDEICNLAIKALEQDPCDDVISRQEAIDAMATWDWQELYLPIHFKQLLEDLPSVSTEKTMWIPISEKLPSDDEYVIVSVLDDHGDTPWKYTTVAWLCNGVWISNNDILCGTAVAWMPLPQPYKGESEGEE